MELVFVDPEPPDAAGGGIRTHIRLSMGICRAEAIPARVYTHNPGAYPGEDAHPIGRRPWLRSPFRGLAYRLAYAENVAWEHAYWLERELAATDVPGRVIEFGDFLGYGFFSLRNPALRPRCQVRVHTPAFLVPAHPAGARARLAARLAAWRERDCLRRAPFLAAPSAEFIREKLPWLRGWEHVPNPLPPTRPSGSIPRARAEMERVYRAGLAGPGNPPASGDEAWTAAPPDPAALASAAKAAAAPDRVLPARFLFLGRVEERKGVLVLVRAFARLAEFRPLASLTIVGGQGDAAYGAKVRAAIAALPPAVRERLAWEDPVKPEGRSALFARFSALCVPSLWENSPYVYFEGMAAGLPCIGSATGEMKAVARETGAASPAPGDEDAWLAALEAHCQGRDAALPERQAAWIAARAESARTGLIACWLRSSGEAL